jgi:hypothetical protein
MSAKEPYSETDALKAALDDADRKRGGRTPKWLTAALTEPARPPRLHPEPARLSGQALINALHGTTPEATDDDEPDDDLPAAA